MSNLLPVVPEGVAPESSHPAPDRLLSGTPEHTTWNIEDSNGEGFPMRAAACGFVWA